MKTIILYKTKYGSTRDYAEFVHRNVPASTLADISDFEVNTLGGYEVVIIGSRTYMGNIEAQHFLEANWDILQAKRVFLFAVGTIDPEAPASKESYQKIPQQIRDTIHYLKVPGRISLEKLNWFESLVAKSQKGGSVDKVNMNMVIPVIEFAKSALS